MSTIIRDYRKKKKITIGQLAEATGLSTGYISQLERGIIEPSLSSLRKISAELGVSMVSLLEEKPENNFMVIRDGDRLTLKNKEKTILYEFLTPLPTEHFIPKSLIIKFTLQPHSQLTASFIAHPSEELVTMVSGRMTLCVGDDEKIVLNPGDSSVIKQNSPHNFCNDSDNPAVGLSVLTPPVWNLNVISK